MSSLSMSHNNFMALHRPELFISQVITVRSNCSNEATTVVNTASSENNVKIIVGR